VISRRWPSVNFGGRPLLYLGYSEPNPSELKLRITSRTRSSLVNATFAIAATSMPCAGSSTICARRQVTTDPLPRRTIRTSRWPSSSSISRTRRRSVTGPVPGDQHAQQKCPAAHRPGQATGSVADVVGVPALPSWRDVELGAPELARLGMARLNSAHLALLGTLRRDGSPRISPIEPHIAEGQLLIGAMAWSAKASDLRRDPRYTLHSVVTGPDTGQGELKLYGPAAEASQDLRAAAADAWWLASAPEKARVFTLHIGQAVFIDWDIKHALMTVHQWSPASGYAVASRPYP
jgi:hypothetical protein